MEKITVASTIEKIEKLIDNNSGDIGRLEHIIDFLKKKKPLYNTDRIYLENKINSEIVFEEEKPVKKTIPIQLRIFIHRGGTASFGRCFFPTNRKLTMAITGAKRNEMVVAKSISCLNPFGSCL